MKQLSGFRADIPLLVESSFMSGGPVLRHHVVVSSSGPRKLHGHGWSSHHTRCHQAFQADRCNFVLCRSRENLSAANYAREVIRALIRVGLIERSFSTLSHARLQLKTTYRTTKGYPAGILPVVPLCRLGSVWTRGMQYYTLPNRIAGTTTGKGPAFFYYLFSTT